MAMTLSHPAAVYGSKVRKKSRLAESHCNLKRLTILYFNHNTPLRIRGKVWESEVIAKISLLAKN